MQTGSCERGVRLSCARRVVRRGLVHLARAATHLQPREVHVQPAGGQLPAPAALQTGWVHGDGRLEGVLRAAGRPSGRTGRMGPMKDLHLVLHLRAYARSRGGGDKELNKQHFYT